MEAAHRFSNLPNFGIMTTVQYYSTTVLQYYTVKYLPDSGIMTTVQYYSTTTTVQYYYRVFYLMDSGIMTTIIITVTIIIVIIENIIMNYRI